jgi:hypothetical protein
MCVKKCQKEETGCVSCGVSPKNASKRAFCAPRNAHLNGFHLSTAMKLALSVLPALLLPAAPPPRVPAVLSLARSPPALLVAPDILQDEIPDMLVLDSLPAPLEKVLVGEQGSVENSGLAQIAEEDACALLGAAGLDGGEQLSLTLCDDERIRELNQQWRSIDAPTDVLSFPMDDEQLLGDLVISIDTADFQAKERHHSLRDELRVRARSFYPTPALMMPFLPDDTTEPAAITLGRY